MDFLKELFALREQEQETVAAGDMKVDDAVHSQLDKAATDDEIDAQCFGLEMEDGKVVKVYVKQEDAEAFEEAMSARLGEDDDIKTALEELGKEFEIVEIVWPDEDEEENSEEDEDGEEEDEEAEEDGDGSDSMNDAVDYDDAKKESVQAPMTIGQRFAAKLNELKWTDEEKSEYDRAANKDVSNDEGGEEEELPDPDEPKEMAPQGASSAWTIDKDEAGIKIANDRFSIELDDDEMMELMNAIADKKIARFKNEHGKVVYVFSPRGSEYILKTPEYQGGFRLPKDIVNKIMD